jgi:hypothetical protein
MKLMVLFLCHFKGGGFAGSLIAKAMSQFKEWRVTLVDSKPYFSNTPALIQSTLTDLSLHSSIQFASEHCIRHDSYLSAPNARAVVAEISLVSPTAVITTEESIDYDYLVIACGCSYDLTPGRPLSTRTVSELSLPIKRAPKILIVGGGSYYTHYIPILPVSAHLISMVANRRFPAQLFYLRLTAHQTDAIIGHDFAFNNISYIHLSSGTP